MPQTFVLPRQLAISSSNQLLSGALLYFYQTNTTTPQAVHSDKDHTVELANPLPADAAGQWAKIYLNPNAAADYRVRITTAAGVLLYQEDDISRFPLSADEIGGALADDPDSAEIIGAALYRRTDAESVAGVTPTNYTYPSGYVLRYGDNITPGTTDMVLPFQAAIDSASAQYPVVNFSNQVAISKPLLIRSTTQQNISLKGSARVTTALMPTAADIKQSPQNVNCLIFNQNNNGHLSLEDFEFFAAAAFTGVCIECTEGGGGDSSGEALFSTIFRRGWIGMPTTANGFLHGGMQNCTFDTINIEGSKGGFIRLEGTGTADVILTNINFLRGFDEIINQTADTNGAVLMTVSNVHAYVHLRGRLFNLQNWKQSNFNNIILEVDVANVGDTGIWKLKDCSSLQISNFCATPRVGTATCAVGIEVDTTSAKFMNGKITAGIGFKVSGTGAIDIELENVDFTDCTTAALQISSNATGTIRTRGCKFSNSTVSGFVDQVANGVNWYSYNDEFLNAGIGGNVASRNIDRTSSGETIISRPRIGQNNGAALAAYYIQNGGAGAFRVLNPTFIGTPPTGLKTGASTVEFEYTPGLGGAISSAATITLPVLGDIFTISGTTTITSVTATNCQGRRVTLVFGGSLTFTDGSNLKLAGDFSATADDCITLVCTDGTNWYEVSRSAN